MEGFLFVPGFVEGIRQEQNGFAAEAEGIPYQLEAAGGGTGTDANAMQISRAGMATGLVSVPLRYMHTPCELLALEDVENAARLLAAFTRRINEHISFIPEP